MRDKEPPNPFDEIQKQLKELFKDSNVKISAHGFPEGGQFSDEQEEIVNEPEAASDGGKSAEALENIRNFNLRFEYWQRKFQSLYAKRNF